jgi:hypothetical protein
MNMLMTMPAIVSTLGQKRVNPSENFSPTAQPASINPAINRINHATTTPFQSVVFA